VAARRAMSCLAVSSIPPYPSPFRGGAAVGDIGWATVALRRRREGEEGAGAAAVMLVLFLLFDGLAS